ncbi:anti-sigma factor [Bacteroidia bacterium]|nr:anti-sigma factor [Bacteroidia bacterium]
MQNLLVRYFSGEAATEEKKTLFSEIETDTELKNEFIQLQNLKGLTCFSSLNRNEELAAEKLTDFYAAIHRNKRRNILFQISKYAAVVLAAALLTAFTVQYFHNNSEPLYSEVEVPVGQRVYLTLADGSSVWLNSRSKIRIPQTFNGKYRKVYLDGEAFFDVETNKNKPFIVETSRYNVRVFGTRFNILNYSEMPLFETTLLEGSVEITNSKGEKSIVLTPNEQVTMVDNHLKKTVIDTHAAATWKDGVLIFDGLPFSEIIKKLELYYDVKFIIQNTRALDGIYTGKFNAKDSAERIIDIIHQTNKFNYRVSWDHKIIYIQ